MSTHLRHSSQLLKEHNMRVTLPRQQIVEYIMRQPRAVSYSEIENEFSATIDRVTVYRTLKTFTENGLIHAIPDEKDTVRYALCKEHCTVEEHKHDHIHFKCVVCGNTTCLENTQIPEIKIPLAFKLQTTTVIASGICEGCNA